MIVPMQHVTLLCRAEDRQSALDRLAGLGIMHATERGGAQDIPDVKSQVEALNRARAALELAEAAIRRNAPKRDRAPSLRGSAARPDPVAIGALDALVAAVDVLAALEKQAGQLRQALSAWAPFGDFDPSDIRPLEAAGQVVRLFRCDPRAVPSSDAERFIRLFRAEPRQAWGVQIGSAELPAACTPLSPPDRPTKEIAQSLQAVERDIEIEQGRLRTAGAQAAALRHELSLREDAVRMAVARASMETEGAVAWLTGFCPGDALADLRNAAARAGWGLVLRAPRPGDAVPTLVRRPRWLQPVQAVFDILGIHPGYREADISGVFLVFFTLFFALLIGDAGYGLVVLAATALARRKLPHAPPEPFRLLTILGTATLGWGALTGNWFGIHPAVLPAWLQPRWPPVSLDAEMQREALMRLCFTIGAVHLTLAHAWNGLLLWPSRKFLAQAGWIVLVWCMYVTACGMVLTQAGFPRWLPWGFGAGLLLVVVFMTDPAEFKEKWIDHAMLPLSLTGSLVDVISYVRLYAVGVATLQVAESFNNMALGIDLPLPGLLRLPLRFLLVGLILVAGHTLNMLLGALAILVHAVRLNTLEFSQHKGLEWAGFAYRPLKRSGRPAAGDSAQPAATL